MAKIVRVKERKILGRTDLFTRPIWKHYLIAISLNEHSSTLFYTCTRWYFFWPKMKKKEIFSSSSSSSRSETRIHGLIGHMKPRLWLSTQLLLDCFLSISAFLKLIFVWFPSYFIFYRKEKTTTKKQAFCVSKTINRLKLCRMRRWRGAHQILWQDDPSLLLLLLFFLLLSTPYHHLFS